MLYTLSNIVGDSDLTTAEGLVNFKLLVPRSMLAAERMMSPVKVAPALRAYGVRAVAVIQVLEPVYKLSSMA